MRGKRNAYRVSVGNLKEEDHFKEPNVDAGLLKWILNRMGRLGALL
jgi:hypothetical protein